MNNSGPINNLLNKNKKKYTNTDPTQFQRLLGQTNNSDIQTIYKRFYNVNQNIDTAKLNSIKNPIGTRP